MWLFLIFVAVPILEISLFITVGGALGLLPTLAIVILTAAMGTYLVRTQGLAELAKLQGSLGQMRDPMQPLAHGAMILAAGLLLLTPGFFTDAVGFSLLVPQVRQVLLKRMGKHMVMQSQTFSTQTPRADEDIIDIEPGPSGWTQPEHRK